MPTQYRLPVHPEGAQEVNATLAIHRSYGQVAYFAAGVPVFCHAESDLVGRRLAAVQLDVLGLATQAELQGALGLHRTTLFRSARKKVQAGEVAGLLGQRPGPKGRHKLTAQKQAEAQRLLAQGRSIRATAAGLGVSEAIVRHALQRGELRRSQAAPVPTGISPRQRSDRDTQPRGGIAVHREVERALAATGGLLEAAPRFEAAEGGVRGRGCCVPCPRWSSIASSAWGSRSMAACGTASTASAPSCSPWP